MLQPASITINASGQRLELLQLGKGPDVVLLHGFPDTAWSFLPVMRRLATAGYRAHAVFQRGYAPSALATDDDYRIDALARDVIGVMDAIGARQAAVVGHDWGAVAAYATASCAPERISTLVTAAVPHMQRFLEAMLTSRQWWRSRYMLKFQLPGAATRFSRPGALESLVAEWSPGWQFSADDLAPVRRLLDDPTRARALLRYYRLLPRQLAHGPTRRRLTAPVSIPVTMIAGADDGCISPNCFTGQDALFPAGLRIEIVPNAGHFTHCEQPDAFSDIVLAAIARSTAGGSTPQPKP